MNQKTIVNVMLVDDEPLARVELNRLLKAHPQVNVVAEAENIMEATQLLELHAVDALFLDIEMPGGTGIELAQQLQGEIPIVFCTAYNEFAVDAFSLNAVDYLLKPVVATRLQSAVEKLLALVDESASVALEDEFKLMVKIADKMKIIQLGDITRFESIGNHAAIYTAQGKAYLHSSLSKIESRLNPSHYFRASRSDIIRLDAIEELEETINYGLQAMLTHGGEVEISRRQAAKLKKQMSLAL
ncbi:LytR/AlgR family response regulator transcription factor [Pseudoalteromonas piscicida]|uniref:DNA-binding response regulator n=1 Tax=Pseudoalteromonas piscicida TaxID=43662 RepID=A0A2A5JQI5_PSEO7|nr:LytTR family DNA-binding domain-containing protein [Pseudoalteromonas piscicida]PCK31589.1 DNA-binding response regulator [Pseudoalteromonas piscicida]